MKTLIIKLWRLQIVAAIIILSACDKEIIESTAIDKKQTISAADDSASVVSIVAGNAAGYKDGPVKEAQFSDIKDIAVTADGTIYVAESYRIRKISNGQVTTVAGTGVSGYKDGSADKAQFTEIADITACVDGVVYVVDATPANGSNLVRKLSKNGIVSTYAGKRNTQGYADGPRKAALFTGISSVAAAPNGEVYIKENFTVENTVLNGSRVRKVSVSDSVSTVITDSIYNGTYTDIYIPANGNLYVTNQNVSSIPFAGFIIFKPNAPADRETFFVDEIYDRSVNRITVPDDGEHIYSADNIGIISKIYKNRQIDEIAGVFPRNPPAYPEEGPAKEVAFNSISGLGYYDHALYVADNNKIKKVTLP